MRRSEGEEGKRGMDRERREREKKVGGGERAYNKTTKLTSGSC